MNLEEMSLVELENFAGLMTKKHLELQNLRRSIAAELERRNMLDVAIAAKREADALLAKASGAIQVQTIEVPDWVK